MSELMDSRITTRVTPTMRKAVEEMAERRGIKVANMMQMIIHEAVKREEERIKNNIPVL